MKKALEKRRGMRYNGSGEAGSGFSAKSENRMLPEEREIQEMEAPLNFLGDTVAAISTPYGKGGVGMIRISGPEAFTVAEAMFRPQSGRRVGELSERQATYGKILYKKEHLDDGILTLYKAPRSFTGENVAEICCHGGVLLTERVLESALLCGAVPAGAGEFSKRAFLNGKITLSEAEAVIDLINAESEAQLRIAGENSTGALGYRVQGIYEDLCRLLASMYAFTDYPDEDLTELSPEELREELLNILRKLETLKAGYRQGHAVMEGLKTVIVGRPNTGKSSLLNGMLGKKRAIVSPIAGTTRDTVEENVFVGRVLLHLCDTAGIHEAADNIEQLGVARSLEKLKEAELILAVFDGSEQATEEDQRLLELLESQKVPVIALLNKSDLPSRFDRTLLSSYKTLVFSAKEEGMPRELPRYLEELFETERLDTSEKGLLTNARQAAATEEALSAVKRALEALEIGQTQDLAALDLEIAMERLGEIDGRSVREDIVSEIFSRFCVGK